MAAEFAKLSIADRKLMKPACEFLSKKPGLAGAYTLTIKPNTKVYRYDVEVYKVNSNDDTKRKTMSRKGPDDAEVSLRRLLCLEIMNAFCTSTNGFGHGNPKTPFVYDGVKQLYLKAPMKLDAGKKRQEFAANDLSEFAQKQLAGYSIICEVSDSEQHEIDISNIESMLGSREAVGDRTISQFLEILTNQQAVGASTHVALGLGALYQRTGEVMENNSTIELRNGISKGIHPVEDNGKTGLVLVVDAKKTAFYHSTYLHMALKGPMSSRYFSTQSYSEFYRGVRVTMSYAVHRSDVIESILEHRPKDITIDGGETLDAYFMRKYNIRIQADLPVVKTERAYYPMDLLAICPNQRVPMEKLDENVRRSILMGTAVVPEERFKRIRAEVQAAQIVPASSLMNAFGIQTSPIVMNVEIKERASPAILAGGNKPQPVSNGAWKLQGQTILPSKALAAGFIVVAPNNFDPRSFVDKLCKTAGNHGLCLGPPTYETIDFSSYASISAKFKEFEARKVRFVLAFDYQRSKSHANLKLAERETKVLTMQIRVETATRPGGASQTLENLSMKLNAKSSGINVIPIIEKCGEILSLQKKVMVIGIDVSLPTRGSPKELFTLREKNLGNLSSHDASVVGITGNYGSQPTTILGDYYYQEASHEVLNADLLKERFATLLTRFKESRGGFPEHLVVFRDGVGEGQLRLTAQAEAPIFQQVCNEHKASTALIYIVVTKKHNKRFALGKSGQEKNCFPGSVIDKGITRPDIPEFYMQSHRPIKGTAKTAHYSILINDKNVPMDAIQAFANHLCFNHQIVNSAVSLPEPVYYAKEMTKRGRSNLLAKKFSLKGQVPRQPNGLMDFNKVSTALSYRDIPLSKIKFAA